MIAVFLALISAANLPTYKYFVIPNGYVEVDIKDELAQSCYEYSKELVTKFLDDFHGPQPVVLLHAWNKKGDDGEYYACEVMRMSIRYLLITHIPNPEDTTHKYLHSVRILNEEAPNGAHWFKPPTDVLELAVSALNEKYGEDVALRNVAVYKTIMNYHKYGQIVIDATKGKERMLFNMKLIKKFGEKEFKVDSIEQIY